MGTLYKYYLQPAFASLDEKSTQSDTCGVLARGLTEWLRQYFSTLTCGIYGTVTSPAGTVTPLGTPMSPLMVCRPVIAPFSLESKELVLAVSVKDNGLANLFNYIGLKITGKLTTWTAEPTVTGICTGALVTSHFRQYGASLYEQLRVLEPDTPDLTAKIWDKFEIFLKNAMTATMTFSAPITGACAGGLFTGIALLNLRKL